MTALQILPSIVARLILEGHLPLNDVTEAALDTNPDEWMCGWCTGFDNMLPVQISCARCQEEEQMDQKVLCYRVDVVDGDRLWIPLYLGVCPVCYQPHLVQTRPPYQRLPVGVSASGMDDQDSTFPPVGY